MGEVPARLMQFSSSTAAAVDEASGAAAPAATLMPETSAAAPASAEVWRKLRRVIFFMIELPFC